jgi:alpha-1,6-mannosyltransferase
MATAASAVIVLTLIALTYYRLPWRKLPDPGDAPAPPEVVEPTLPAPQTAKPGAYADSP